MSDIGKGDWVECVNAEGRTCIAVGGVYHVQALLEAPRPGNCTHCGALNHLYIVPTDVLWGLCPTRFRPLKRGPGTTTPAEKEIEYV